MRSTHLAWWRERLGLATMADLPGTLPRVEAALRELQKAGRAGKTLANYAEAIRAFCAWATARGLLEASPIEALAGFDTTPVTRRRAMGPEEIARLLAACATHRRDTLETALVTGLRARELRSLAITNLDAERCGLTLEAAWTKNRVAGFQPLPRDLMLRLRDHAASDMALAAYLVRYRGAWPQPDIPARPLLYVPSHTARDLDYDLQAAGIAKQTPDGKIDFHACRVAYINLVIESGATVREAQTLARHLTPTMTMNTYGRTRSQALAETVEGIADAIGGAEKCVTGVSRPISDP
jgi:integrase